MTIPTEQFEKFLEAFKGAQVVKSTNSVTGEEQVFPDGFTDMEEIYDIRGEFDRQTIEDAFNSALQLSYLQGVKNTEERVVKVVEGMKSAETKRLGYVPFPTALGNADQILGYNAALTDIIQTISKKS